MREFLPSSGVWSVEDLAEWLGMKPADLQQKLSDIGVPIISLSSKYRHKLFRLEDLRKKERKQGGGD